jgi:putative transcriptional regulator
MYHYLECGLPRVWLANGYTIHQTPYGEGVSIHDLAGLHRVIGWQMSQQPRLTGAEFRFLRKEMGLSQKRLADMIGTSEQTVALWEKRGKMPKTADRMTRIIYREQQDGNVKIAEMIERLCQLDEAEHAKLVLESLEDGWHQRAA